MKKSSNMVTKLFFNLLPVQILLIAIGSINSVIDGVIASNYISPGAMTVIGLYMPAMKIIETINAVLQGVQSERDGGYAESRGYYTQYRIENRSALCEEDAIQQCAWIECSYH